MEKEELKDYFTRYPNSDEVFENGGVLFHQHGSAESYTKGDTVKYTRAQVMAEKVTIDENSENADLLKEVALETLKTADIATLEYKAMKALAKDLQLTPADKKQETLIIALTEFKSSLNAE